MFQQSMKCVNSIFFKKKSLTWRQLKSALPEPGGNAAKERDPWQNTSAAANTRKNSLQNFSIFVPGSSGIYKLFFFSYILCIFRKRCLNFICNLELSLDIPADIAYNLFKDNLGRAEIVGYLHTFNLPDWASQLDFALGQKDKEQWQVSSPQTHLSP